MIYRNYGNSGLKVSVISLGTVINFKPENFEVDTELFKVALQKGINFIDSAEIYGGGKAEQTLGKALKKLEVPREQVVIATKIWVCQDPEINSKMTTNKKHIKESVKKSLDRLQLDYVDIIYAHFLDQDTPLQEICRSFHEIIEEGKAFYWATSNWESEAVFMALSICQKLNLHKPIGTQHQYNMLVRHEIESEYSNLIKKYNYGLACWSALAGGFLTGKYLDGIDEKEKSRLNDKTSLSVNLLRKIYYEPHANLKTIEALKRLQKLAEDLKCKIHHLAIAWLIKEEWVSTAIVGARNKEQLLDTLIALEVMKKFTPELEKEINSILDNAPAKSFRGLIYV